MGKYSQTMEQQQNKLALIVTALFYVKQNNRFFFTLQTKGQRNANVQHILSQIELM